MRNGRPSMAGRLGMPARLALAYVLFSAVWIVASDWVVQAVWGASAAVTAVQSVKGLVFVAVSAGFIYWLAATLNARAVADLETRVAERTREIREANAELEAFVYWVAHDLRAPLRSMAGFSTALLEDFGDDLAPAARGYAERIGAAALRMDQLIGDLLDYSHVRRQELTPAPIDLDGVVAEVLEQLRPQIEETGARVAVEGPLPRVQGHARTLRQVLVNLVANSLKFAPDGEPPEVHLWARANGSSEVVLWVEDRGIGFAREHQERIFAPFERLHGVERYPGTGLGLAIVRKGVEKMGGAAGVESAPGEGSRFWLRLGAP